MKVVVRYEEYDIHARDRRFMNLRLRTGVL